MQILIAPDSSRKVCQLLRLLKLCRQDFLRPCPDASFDLLPVGDGGEGTMAALTAALGWAEFHHTVTGPLLASQ